MATAKQKAQWHRWQAAGTNAARGAYSEKAVMTAAARRQKIYQKAQEKMMHIAEVRCYGPRKTKLLRALKSTMKRSLNRTSYKRRKSF
jgi:hypothetical protein